MSCLALFAPVLLSTLTGDGLAVRRPRPPSPS
jgi:hypothetical protein